MTYRSHNRPQDIEKSSHVLTITNYVTVYFYIEIDATKFSCRIRRGAVKSVIAKRAKWVTGIFSRRLAFPNQFITV